MKESNDEMIVFPRFLEKIPEFATKLQHGVAHQYVFVVDEILSRLYGAFSCQIQESAPSLKLNHEIQKHHIDATLETSKTFFKSTQFKNAKIDAALFEILRQILPQPSRNEVDATLFFESLKTALFQWHAGCFSKLMNGGIFSTAFHYTPKDFECAGYPFYQIKHPKIGIEINGVCEDFAFSQMCEEESYDALFGQRRGYNGSTLESSAPLSAWGYVPIKDNQHPANGDMVVYGAFLDAVNFGSNHYGIFYNGVVLSKLGVLNPIMYHPVQNVSPFYGNCYFVLRKICIPKLQSDMKAHLTKEAKYTPPLTQLGILSRFNNRLEREFSARLDKVLPISGLTNVGQQFLVRYRDFAEKQFKKASQKELPTPESTIAELNSLIDKMKLTV